MKVFRVVPTNAGERSIWWTLDYALHR